MVNFPTISAGILMGIMEAYGATRWIHEFVGNIVKCLTVVSVKQMIGTDSKIID